MAGLSGLKSFWHAMTSNDRHANHDSPYRTTGPNQHIGVGRNPALQSVAASGGMGTYHDDPASRSTTALATSAGGYSPRSPPNGTTNSPTSPYSPGMRSAAVNGDPPGGGIALQDFGADGMPPPPPVAHSWTRIDKWTEDNYPELFDQLCVPATVNDVNELEFSLDCSLPIDVRESLQVHDGQERGGTPTGIIFSAMLLDCEEILDEWKNWRVVEQEYLAPQALPGAPGSAGPSKRNSQIIAKSGLLEKQGSHPEGAVQKAYAHPGWIPLARDWGGNNIAVDLAPGPNGTWGQIILFGRDYDIKYVVSKSWAHFLAMVADDLASDNWYVDEETQDLRLKDPKAPRAEPTYLEILRVRNERKYGRRRFSRRSMPPPPQRMPGSGSSFVNGSSSSKPKEENLMSDNHLKPPSKKSPKPLRSVAEEISIPVPSLHKPENEQPKETNLLDDLVPEDRLDLASKVLEEIRLDDPEPEENKAKVVLV